MNNKEKTSQTNLSIEYQVLTTCRSEGSAVKFEAHELVGQDGGCYIQKIRVRNCS